MFKKVLFATTGSPSCDDAARVAFDIAKKNNAELIIFHVPGITFKGFRQTVIDVRTGEEVNFDQDYVDWVNEELKTTYEKQIKTHTNCIIEAVPGMPHREILRKARKNNVDLIVMGASSKNGDDEISSYRRNIVGSTFQAVAKAARCPVLVIGRPAASFWGGFSNVMFGTDFSKPSDSAFMFACKIARTFNCSLHLFHALDINSIHAGKIQDQDEIEDKIIEARKKMNKMYINKLKDISDYDVEIWEGIPYVEIVKFAREKFCDLIVMAHHTIERENTQLGSTLEQVILRASCPVISVNHPDKASMMIDIKK